MHLCACGCGNRVVTPLSPKGWRLIFDGSFSLYPSIGNWSFPCQSHYWIRNESVIWSESWSKEMIEKVRERDEAGIQTLSHRLHNAADPKTVDPGTESAPIAKKGNRPVKRKGKAKQS
jgi:hypothetical protein